MNDKLGGAHTFRCKDGEARCGGRLYDRDFNGARNILLRNASVVPFLWTALQMVRRVLA